MFLRIDNPQRRHKLNLAQSVDRHQVWRNCSVLSSSYSGVSVEFHFATDFPIELITPLLPMVSESVLHPDLKICLLAAQQFDSTRSWSEDRDWDLEVIKTDENCRIGLQRDFSGTLWPNANQAVLIIDPLLSDSFFNGMRWLLPPYLLEQNSFVLHSSGFIDKAGFAHVFYGPSGAGKTTLVSMMQDFDVLGDDLTMLGLQGNQLVAEACSLGQNPGYMGQPGRIHPVAGLYALQKADFNSFTTNNLENETLQLLANCSIGDWDHLSERQYNSLLSLILRALKTTRLQRLNFSKDGTVKELFL